MRINRIALRAIMLERDFPQSILAEKTGISRATINGVCNGRSCSDRTGKRIAEALNVPVEELIETH